MNYLSPEGKFSIKDLLPRHLSLEKTLGSRNLKAFSFTNGGQLLPFKEILGPKFQRLWASALSRPLDDNLVMEDSSEYPYLSKDKIIIIKDDKSEIPVFFSYRDVITPGDMGLYFHICLVDKEYQGMGLTTSLIKYAINESKPKFIALMTQNQHMVQTLRPFCPSGLLFPIDGSPPDDLKAIANILIANKPDFNENTFVWKGVYSDGSPLYGDRAERRSNHPEIRDYFEKNVNFQNGDAVLIIGKLK